MRCITLYFNPRSPHGERLTAIRPKEVICDISIHAPRMGSNRPTSKKRCRILNFNPRSPHGERRASYCTPAFLTYFNPRSPHGERLCHISRNISATIFQSTLPAWGATVLLFNIHRTFCISIHAPRMGSDHHGHHVRRASESISIHAPRMGSDFFCYISCNISTNFNPRSPHGERLFISILAASEKTFQSTLPAWGATLRRNTDLLNLSYFNPRSPHGERHCPHEPYFQQFEFQSTLPAWGATDSGYLVPFLVDISIHAPRMGSDERDARGGTRYTISIHAPRMGSDGSADPRGKDDHDFNPRSPHGERQRPYIVNSASTSISIHAPRMGSDMTF